MICDVCGKQKASVHLTEVVNDQITKLNLCEYCAKKKGSQVEQHFGIADLLQGLTGGVESDQTLASTVERLKCANCGMTFDEFKKIGRLGCASCYESFKEHLYPLLRRIHGSNQHHGKRPRGHASAPAGPKRRVTDRKTAAKSAPVSKMSELQKLKTEMLVAKAKLKKTIEAEDFEKAVVIRDKIRILEEKIKARA